MKLGLASPPEPGAHILQCGICGIEVHRVAPAATEHVNAYEFEQVLLGAEVACEEHLAGAHPLRYRLWRRLRWDWLIRGML